MSIEPEGRVIGKSPEPTNTEETFEAAVIRMIQDLDRRVVQLVDDLIGTDKAVSYHNDRLGKLEASAFSETGDDRITEAHRRITAETDRLNNLRQMHYNLAERVKRLEGQTHFETSEDDARLRQLEKTVGYLKQRQDVWENSWSQTVTRINHKIMSIDNHLRVDVEDQVAGLERKLGLLVDSQNDWTSQFGERLVALEGHPRPLDLEQVRAGERLFTKAPNAGDVMVMSNVDERRRDDLAPKIRGIQAVVQQQYERGYSMGLRAGIDEAVSRVDNLPQLEPPFGSAIGIGKKKAIIEAIRAVVTSKLGADGPAEDMTLTPEMYVAPKDHPFIKPRPIRDNPQA